MAKAFASSGDMEAKKISFTEVGRDLYAFTAEGDPTPVLLLAMTVSWWLMRRQPLSWLSLWLIKSEKSPTSRSNT